MAAVHARKMNPPVRKSVTPYQVVTLQQNCGDSPRTTSFITVVLTHPLEHEISASITCRQECRRHRPRVSRCGCSSAAVCVPPFTLPAAVRDTERPVCCCSFRICAARCTSAATWCSRPTATGSCRPWGTASRTSTSQGARGAVECLCVSGVFVGVCHGDTLSVWDCVWE